MKKEIKFSAKLDTQEFDRTVEALQRKLKDIYKTSEQGRNSFQTQERLSQAGLGPAVNPMQRAQQEERLRRETDRFIKQQIKDQEKLAKTLNDQLDAAKKLQEQMKNLAKGTEERTRAEQKLLEMQEKAARTNAQFKAKESVIGDALSSRPQQGMFDRLGMAYSRGGVGGAMRAGGRMASQAYALNPATFIGGAISGVAAAAGGAAQLGGRYMELPSEVSVNRGAAQSVENRILEQMLSGGALEERLFARQREEARKEASSFRTGRRVSDAGGLLARLGGYAGAGALAGSAVPVVGTGLGALAGLGVGLYRNSEETLGQLGIGQYGKNTQAQYDAMEKQRMQEVFNAKKELDPTRKLLADDFQRNFMPNLQTQRAMGMSDDQLGSFFGNVTGAGFTRGMGRQSAEAILAAGGTTRGAAGGALTSLKAQRDFNLTNADQIMGRLSGTMGSAGASDRALFGIMSAAMKEGLDKSEFASENRKFTQSVAEAVYRSGITDEGSAAALAESMSNMIASRTGRGMEAAQGAFQFKQGVMGATSGMGSVMEMGGILSDQNLRKLDPAYQAAIGGMDEQQLLAAKGTPMMSEMAKQAGVSEDELIKKVRGLKADKFGMSTIFGGQAYSKLKKLGGPGPKTLEEQAELESARGLFQASMSAEYGIKDVEIQKSLLKDVETGSTSSFEELQRKAKEAQQKFETTTSTRVGDAAISTQAGMEGIVNDLEKQFRPQVQGAADDMIKLREAMQPLINQLKTGIATKEEGLISSAMKSIQERLTSGGMIQETQPQVTPQTK
jgi:hypothetical protein